MEQLIELTKPFPSRLIKKNPSGGGDYVAHENVVQRLLFVVGPYSWKLHEIVRGDVAAIPPKPNAKSERGKKGCPALTNAVVGAVCTLKLTIDGEPIEVDEIGDCEDPHNWPHDGARLKDAMSDAIKRCSMRLGLGLHLWAQDSYFLHDRLVEEKEKREAEK